ncbi:MAG: hypothetical protein O2923_10840 [Verrucomicrobia bacterium]|nr:hypothetical protein [Verrucomicrobiota bacterium]MDA1087125.1 hypothetical protein [Verrucomicrobiota bacterium]
MPVERVTQNPEANEQLLYFIPGRKICKTLPGGRPVVLTEYP